MGEKKKHLEGLEGLERPSEGRAVPSSRVHHFFPVGILFCAGTIGHVSLVFPSLSILVLNWLSTPARKTNHDLALPHFVSGD